MSSTFLTDVFSLLIDYIDSVEGELVVVETKSCFLSSVLENENPLLSSSWKTVNNEFSLFKEQVLNLKKVYVSCQILF